MYEKLPKFQQFKKLKWKDEEELTHSLIKRRQCGLQEIEIVDQSIEDIFNDERLGPNTRKSNEFVT